MEYNDRTMTYTTRYGDKISYDFYKGLEKHEIKDIIRSIFEKGVLKNSEPLKVEFVKHVISDSGSYGTSVPVATWKDKQAAAENNKKKRSGIDTGTFSESIHIQIRI